MIVISYFSAAENTDVNFINVPTSKYKSLRNMELTTDESCFFLNGVSYIHHFLSLASSPEKRSNICFMQH